LSYSPNVSNTYYHSTIYVFTVDSPFVCSIKKKEVVWKCTGKLIQVICLRCKWNMVVFGADNVDKQFKTWYFLFMEKIQMRTIKKWKGFRFISNRFGNNSHKKCNWKLDSSRIKELLILATLAISTRCFRVCLLLKN